MTLDEEKKNINKDDKITKAKKLDLTKKNQNEKKIIEELKVKLKESEDRTLRSLAEIENLRKRHERELDNATKYAVKSFANSLLSVADNFERAMKLVPKETSEDEKVLKNLIIGIQAIEKDFYKTFENNGITKFSSVNMKFDPELHQAVSKQPSDVIKEGFIVEELQSGFKIENRLLRPAMVVVSEGQVKAKVSPEENKPTFKPKDAWT